MSQIHRFNHPLLDTEPVSVAELGNHTDDAATELLGLACRLAARRSSREVAIQDQIDECLASAPAVAAPRFRSLGNSLTEIDVVRAAIVLYPAPIHADATSMQGPIEETKRFWQEEARDASVTVGLPVSLSLGFGRRWRMKLLRKPGILVTQDILLANAQLAPQVEQSLLSLNRLYLEAVVSESEAIGLIRENTEFLAGGAGEVAEFQVNAARFDPGAATAAETLTARLIATIPVVQENGYEEVTGGDVLDFFLMWLLLRRPETVTAAESALTRLSYLDRTLDMAAFEIREFRGFARNPRRMKAPKIARRIAREHPGFSRLFLGGDNSMEFLSELEDVALSLQRMCSPPKEGAK